MCVCMYVCVCNLSYSACKVHGPYYIVICSLSESTVFLGKRNLLNIKQVLLFSLQPLSEKFSNFKKNSAILHHKYMYLVYT